jgi:hypothetical protein
VMLIMGFLLFLYDYITVAFIAPRDSIKCAVN